MPAVVQHASGQCSGDVGTGLRRAAPVVRILNGAHDYPNFGTSFANAMLKSPVQLIRVACFKATDASQPWDVTAKVMGLIGPGGCYSGFDDYFWGKGPVGPDIAGAYFNAMWYLTH